MAHFFRTESTSVRFSTHGSKLQSTAAHGNLSPAPASLQRLVHKTALSKASLVQDANHPFHVCVIGGGVVGLTSALRLLQLNYRPGSPVVNSDSPDCNADAGVPRARRHVEVTVVAAGFGADTTTAGAAGLWGPYKLSDTPEQLVNRWGADTYNHLLQLAHSGLADVAGVSMVSCNSLYPEPGELPFWRHIPLNFNLMDERTLAGVSRQARAGSDKSTDTSVFLSDSDSNASTPDPEPFPCNWGYHWNSIVCEGSRYLPWLTAQVRSLGGRLRRVPRLSSLEQLSCPEVGLSPADIDLVVNAVGLGSLELLPDPDVVPIRGQVVRVEAPWVKQAYFYDPYYIIPNRDAVVLGGTGQKGNFNLTVSLEDKRRIMDGCCRLLPSLRGARSVADWVGLRPGRTSLRLELQREGVRLGGGTGVADMGSSGRLVPLVHNYGHGGAGLTLAWGCAGDVVKLVLEEGLLD